MLVKDLDLLKAIQIKDFHKFNSRRMFQEIGIMDARKEAESMLIIQKGQRWKEVRSILTPTFNASKMKQSVPLINDAIDALLENVEKNSEQDREFDIYELFQGLTMDTIGRSAFGIRTNVQRNPDDRFLKAAQAGFSDQFKKSFLRELLFFLHVCFPEFGMVLYPLRWLQYRILDLLGLTYNGILFSVSKEIVEARRKNLEDPQNPWSRQDLLQSKI